MKICGNGISGTSAVTRRCIQFTGARLPFSTPARDFGTLRAHSGGDCTFVLLEAV
jgi:hypothetical protein